ncbi:MAG TPA: hypothetical protein VK475_05575 [Pyrinomonadaceae bacterium]|nr:hypothetical protein [Pyrinomonadaceae bacterium]
MTRPAEANAVELKRCPRCEESLPQLEFGVCRARKDGLNLYCKRCIRQKIAHSRQALREYKNARIKHGTTAGPDKSRVSIDAKSGFSPRRIARMLRKLSPADRVREAIRCGARTQKEIAHVTRLPKDEVCDALANLLLWTREIRTQVINHTRMYFVNEVAEELLKAREAAEAKRKRGLNPSFSSVGVLMPGRKPSAKGKKRSLKTTTAAQANDHAKEKSA